VNGGTARKFRRFCLVYCRLSLLLPALIRKSLPLQPVKESLAGAVDFAPAAQPPSVVTERTRGAGSAAKDTRPCSAHRHHLPSAN